MFISRVMVKVLHMCKLGHIRAFGVYDLFKNDRTGTRQGLETHHPKMERGHAPQRPDTNTHTLKSHFLLVNFYFFLPQFQIKRACFSLVFPTYLLFCTQIVVNYFFKSLFISQFVLLTLKRLPTYSSEDCQPFSKSQTINWTQILTTASISAKKVSIFK